MNIIYSSYQDTLLYLGIQYKIIHHSEYCTVIKIEGDRILHLKILYLYEDGEEDIWYVVEEKKMIRFHMNGCTVEQYTEIVRKKIRNQYLAKMIGYTIYELENAILARYSF